MEVASGKSGQIGCKRSDKWLSLKFFVYDMLWKCQPVKYACVSLHLCVILVFFHVLISNFLSVKLNFFST